RFAIVDRTPGQSVFPVLEAAAKARNERAIYDPETKKQIKSIFQLERIDPNGNNAQAINQQRFELSQRVLKGDFFGFLEIGPDVYEYSTSNSSGKEIPAVNDRTSLRYQSNKPNYGDFFRWAEKVANAAIEQKRFADNPALKKAGLGLADIQQMQ